MNCLANLREGVYAPRQHCINTHHYFSPLFTILIWFVLAQQGKNDRSIYRHASDDCKPTGYTTPSFKHLPSEDRLGHAFARTLLTAPLKPSPDFEDFLPAERFPLLLTTTNGAKISVASIVSRARVWGATSQYRWSPRRAPGMPNHAARAWSPVGKRS